MSIVIDRRSESGKGRGSRERLIQRTRDSARDAIKKSIKDGNITDIGKNGADVTIPKGGLSEPSFHHGNGGINHKVLPGNNNEKARFRTGDRLPKPEGASGSGSKGSPDGEGEDSFVYHLSEQEFLNLLFEDLELPNLFKLGADDDQLTTLEQAGFSHTGSHNRLCLIRSKLEKTKREVCMNRKTNERILALLNEEKEILSVYAAEPHATANTSEYDTASTKAKIRLLTTEVDDLKELYLDAVSPNEKLRVASIQDELDALNEKKRLVGKWRDHTDLRYRAVEEEPLPTSKAVMFCEMDVSGSMDEDMKSNAKLFFFLLHRFLQRQYDHVDVVFIRHHSVADEVSEKEFFEGRVTGGTVVSTAHEKLLEIQQARYPEQEWNIYGAQASDGDNFTNDNEKTVTLMKKILPLVQGFFHIEVGQSSYREETDLWRTYKPLTEAFKDRFWMEKVRETKDVWPVFRQLFKKRAGTEQNMQPRSNAFNLG